MLSTFFITTTPGVVVVIENHARKAVNEPVYVFGVVLTPMCPVCENAEIIEIEKETWFAGKRFTH